MAAGKGQRVTSKIHNFCRKWPILILIISSWNTKELLKLKNIIKSILKSWYRKVCYFPHPFSGKHIFYKWNRPNETVMFLCILIWFCFCFNKQIGWLLSKVTSRIACIISNFSRTKINFRLTNVIMHSNLWYFDSPNTLPALQTYWHDKSYVSTMIFFQHLVAMKIPQSTCSYENLPITFK